ncbi:MAG: serine/threonine protein kinase, partial [Planctomycetes bacterium]|nr:serine/threonine protein kinase [Planctomycetota bacterium]
MGVVYRAQDTRNGSTVALKVLLRELVKPEQLERFRREVMGLEGVTHPNLVRVLALNLGPPCP